MKKYAVSFISFFDNMLEIKVVIANDWRDALNKGFKHNFSSEIDIDEAKNKAFDGDWMFDVVEII